MKHRQAVGFRPMIQMPVRQPLMRHSILIFTGLFSQAAMCATLVTRPDDMVDRYADMTRCMDRAMGSGWPGRYDIEMIRNRWGSLEVSARDIAEAPLAIRLADLRCRRELSLDRQPRPG